MGTMCLPLFSIAFDPILFILAGNKDLHKVSDEFEFRPDQTTDYRVSWPWASKKIPIRLIIEKWYLHASLFIFDRIIIKVAGNQDRQKSLVEFDFGPKQATHFGVTCPWAMKIHTFELEYLWSQLANLDQMLCVASLGWGKGCIRFWGRLDQNSCFHGNRKPLLTYNGENDVFTFSRLFFILSFLYLQVTRICIKARTSLNFGQIGPLTTELAALEI